MLRRLLAAAVLALVLAGFGAFHSAASPSHASLYAGGGPNLLCNGTPSAC